MSVKRKSLLDYGFKSKKVENESTPGQQEVLKTSSQEVSRSETVSNSDINIMDIGGYLGIAVEDSKKYVLLTSPWIPGESFTFSGVGKRNLKFLHHWLRRYEWLVYTQAKGAGALCKYCALFPHEYAGKGKHQQLNSFVTKPFQKWKDAIENFEAHSKCQYHASSIIYADNLIKVWTRAVPDIRSQIEVTRMEQIKSNRSKLVPIIEVIKLCGRQELALRGTDDCGMLAKEQEHNDGNLRALLRMRIACGDEIAKHHFENAAKNATYLSPTIQNEIIATCGEIIQRKIVERINMAKSFSILVDETTDIGQIEQMSLCVRYIDVGDSEKYIMREDFLQFVALQNTTGHHIAEVILKPIRAVGIDEKYMIGQGYDGAAAMKGSFNGVQAIIRKRFPAALYVHCYSHSLNLALGHACEVHYIRHCLGIVKTIASFFKKSAKRSLNLTEKIKTIFPQAKSNKLISCCATRWVENHGSLLRFKEMLPAIVIALEELLLDPDTDASSKASSFLKSVTSCEFVVSLFMASTVFSLTLPLCKTLQSVSLDLPKAIEHIEVVLQVLNDFRCKVDKKFSEVFGEVCQLLTSINEEVKLPRIAYIQQERTGISTRDPEAYFRVTIAIPFLDDISVQLNDKFVQHKSIIHKFSFFVPSICCLKEVNFSESDAKEFEIYKDIIDTAAIAPEFTLWKAKWSQEESCKRPSSAIEALDQCNKTFFPAIYSLLKVFATIPVTTCTSERSFSTLKRLKSFLRNSTGEERLNGLAIMSTHRRFQIETDEVINDFAAKKSRRLNLIFN